MYIRQRVSFVGQLISDFRKGYIYLYIYFFFKSNWGSRLAYLSWRLKVSMEGGGWHSLYNNARKFCKLTRRNILCGCIGLPSERKMPTGGIVRRLLLLKLAQLKRHLCPIYIQSPRNVFQS